MPIAVEPDALSCATCGVETDLDHPEICPICADRATVDAETGQVWITQADLAARAQVSIVELGPDQWGVSASGVGIGQTMQVVRTPDAVLLWDPIGLVDAETVAFIRSLGPVDAIVAEPPAHVWRPNPPGRTRSTMSRC